MCGTKLAEPDETFCSCACTSKHIEQFLADLSKEQALGPESSRGHTKFSILVPPAWAVAQHWFYFVDARRPDVACFGTLGDAERCIVDGGWPRAVPNDEARAYENRVDAIAMWHVKKTR